MSEFFDESVETSKKAVASFVLGLVSVLCVIIAGLPAIVLGIWALFDIDNSEGRLRGKGYAIAGIALPLTLGLMVPVFIALLLPAVQAAREAARRNSSMNNMKQIALGMMNHADAKGSYPAAGDGLEGPGAGLSWRVHLLPYLDHQTLYSQFHLDEPWDSEHNKKLISQMPDVYKSPGHDDEAGKTLYLVPTGDRALFHGQPRGPTFASIRDGTPNTILLVEANPEAGVVWTKPDDWVFNPEDPARNLGGARYGGVCLMAFANGTVRGIDVGLLQPRTLSALFTPDGREEIREPL